MTYFHKNLKAPDNSQMRFSLLYIRLKQLQRQINELGLYNFIIFGIACYIIIVAYKQFSQDKNSIYPIIAFALVCLWIQFSRKDKSFIYKHLDDPHLQIFLEYAALTFPFSISCIVTKSWYCFPALLFLLFWIPFLSREFRNKTVFKNLSFVIPSANFEWISGFRKQYVAIIFVYFLALDFSWFKILPLFLLWLLTGVIASFFTECESIGVLRENNKSSSGYLFHKIKVVIIYVLILYLPIITINTIFNPDFLLLNLLFIPMQISVLCFAIFLKYSVYRPNIMQGGNTIVLSIILLSSALPYLLPVPTIISIVYFYKAKNNLKQYLND